MSVAGIAEFGIVRIIALHGSPESRLAIPDAERPPRIGDEGTVVYLVPTFDSGDPGTRYTVECSDGGAGYIWLAEFSRDQLQLASHPR